MKTESFLLKKGKSAYRNLTEEQLAILKSINAIPVQRNSGIDGFLNEYVGGRPISVKIQKEEETIKEAIEKLLKASKTKKCIYMICIRTHIDNQFYDYSNLPNNLLMMDAYDLKIKHFLKKEKINECIQAI